MYDETMMRIVKVTMMVRLMRILMVIGNVVVMTASM